MDCSPPGSPFHGILQARILEWFAMPSSRGSSQPRDWSCVYGIAVRFFTTEPPGKPKCMCVCVCVCVCVHVRACVSCSVVSNSFRPTDCSPPGSFVHGISQARILEWVAISFSRRSSWPRDWTWVSCIADRLFTINQLFSNKIENIIKMSNSPLPLPKYLFPTTRKKND